MARTLGLVAVLLAGFVLLSTTLLREESQAGVTPAARTTRLVVLISIDQLRGDYLTRWHPHFGPGGFKRLMRDGAFYENTYYTYACSATAPGHATLATGCLPRQHGIVGNKWYLEPGVTKGEYAVEDERYVTLGLPPGSVATGKSPHRLIGSTLGDEMKLADRRSRVFSVSLKDRAAIFTAGKNANGAYWWDKGSGHFVSSTYYVDELPDYVRAFNENAWADRFLGESWEPLLSAEAYAGTYPLDASWHPILQAYGAAFPHTLPSEPGYRYYAMLYATPFGNELVLEVARRLVEREGLGAGPAPDLLCVGLSSNDPAGHAFGSDSAEALDITVRTDRQLAAFLDFLDRRVGLENCLIAVTGDHGVTTANQLASQVRLNAGQIDPQAMITGLNDVFADVLGSRMPNGPLALGFNQPWVYCDPVFAELDATVDGALSRAGAEYLRSIEGIQTVFTGDELAGPAPSRDDRDRWLAWRCYQPDRSGQFCVKVEPFWYRVTDNLAGHNGGFRSDRHVPLVLFGPRVVPGRYAVEADTTDIAVTLARLLGIQPPSDAVGRVLHEALDTAPLP